MEATMDGILAKDGDPLYVDHGGLRERMGGRNDGRPRPFYLTGVKFRRGV